MAAVWDAVEAFVPWYSSVHRGSGAEVPALHRRLRGRPRHRRRVRRRPRRRRRRLRPQHDGGDQRPVRGAAAGDAGARGRGRAPLQPAALAASRSPAAPVHQSRGRAGGGVRASAPGGAPADRPDRGHRRLERHGGGLAGRRARRAGPCPRRPAARRCRAARSAPAHRHGRRRHRLPRAVGPQALRAVRCRGARGRPFRAGHGSAAPARRRGDRARDARRRDLGGRARAPRGRLAERRGRRGARRRLPRPARLRDGRVAAYEGALPPGCGARSPRARPAPADAVARSEPTASVSRPSPSTATGTRCSRRS